MNRLVVMGSRSSVVLFSKSLSLSVFMFGEVGRWAEKESNVLAGDMPRSIDSKTIAISPLKRKRPCRGFSNFDLSTSVKCENRALTYIHFARDDNRGKEGVERRRRRTEIAVAFNCQFSSVVG